VNIPAGCSEIAAEIFISGNTRRASAAGIVNPTYSNSGANFKFSRQLPAIGNNTDRLMP